MRTYSDLIIKILEKIVHPMCYGANYVSLIVVGLMPLPVVCDVLSRLIFKKSIPGIIDIEEFALVIIVFFTLAYTQIKKEHVSIDIVVSRLPQRQQITIDCFNYLICTVFFSLMSCALFWQSIKKIGVLGMGIKIPISIFICAAALGAILLTLTLLIDFLKASSWLLQKGSWSWFLVVVVLGIIVLVSPVLVGMLPWRLSGLSLGTLGMCFFFLLLFLRMPIGFAMALVGFLGMWIVNKWPTASFNMLGSSPYSTTAHYILAVVPLFILMGELAFSSGISQDLFDTANKWLGRMPGGLAMSAVAGCAGFAAVCGDSLATATTMGTVALPEMRKKKYDAGLATGCLAAGGTLGILIPPSMGFIFYAIISEESIGKLFIAGILPGVLLTGLFLTIIYIIALRNPALAPPSERSSWREKLISLKGITGMLSLFILVLGGILGGIFSPTEGGAIGAFGAFLSALLRRRLTRNNLVTSIENTVKTTGKLITILIGVGVLGYFLAATRLPFALADIVTGFSLNRYLVFAGITILYIILGCLMNVIPMILLTLPAILPTVLALGFDPIWFGVVTVILMEMGQITPPIGVNVFAIHSVARDVPMERIFRGIVPFFLAMVVCVIILTLFPQIALFLPNLLIK